MMTLLGGIVMVVLGSTVMVVSLLVIFVVVLVALGLAVLNSKLFLETARARHAVEALADPALREIDTSVLDAMRPFIREETPRTIKSALSEGLCFVFLFFPRVFLLIFSLSCYLTLATLAARIGKPRPNGTSNEKLAYSILTKSLNICTRGVLASFGIYHVQHDYTMCNNKPTTWDGTAPTIISNHVSLIDALVLCTQDYVPSFVAKAEVGRMPLVGSIGRVHNTVFVERENKAVNSGASAADKLAERQRAHKAGDAPVVVFAEGTTTNGKYILNFRSGSFRTGLPVHMCLIRYKGITMDPAFETVKPPFYVLRMMCQWKASVTVTHVGKYTPSEEEKSNPELFASNVHTAMVRASAAGGENVMQSSNGTLAHKRAYEKVQQGKESLLQALTALKNVK